MAPLKAIDYVVVHEMCHMVHLNHDRSYWRLVGKIIPDYEELENWLALSILEHDCLAVGMIFSPV
jgi:predicted metal-dependent hydrolase